MYRSYDRKAARVRRHRRVRKVVTGTPERPRLSVSRSLKHISVQVIDDHDGKTLVAASTHEEKLRGKGGMTKSAELVGAALAERAKEKGITQVVFDRGGYIYHGRIAALADAARKAGLVF